MKRRIVLSGLLTLPFAGSAFAEQAWSAEWLQGNFDGKAYQAGLHIILQPGWKTYWRNPGEGGIPPDIKVKGENLGSCIIAAPLPTRIQDESGEAIGYHEEVVFPIALSPLYAAVPLNIRLKSFFGVCAQVCTPAKFNGVLQFQPSSAPAPASKVLEKWMARVPKLDDFISGSIIKNRQLVLDLKTPVEDIFVEGPDRYYFRKPDLNQQPGKAVLKVDGLKSDDDLRSAKLRITAARQGQGIEQTIILA